MKKLVCAILTLSIVFGACLGVFAARTVDEETRTVKKVSELTDDEIIYQCSFKAKLDDTYKNTWLYKYSEQGTLNVTLTRGYLMTEEGSLPSDYIFTFTKKGKNYSYYNDSSSVPFGARGRYEVDDNMYFINEDMDNLVRTYLPDPDSRERFILHFDFTVRKGEKKISLFMYDACRGRTNGKYMSKTSTIDVDMDTFTERDKFYDEEDGGGKASDVIFDGSNEYDAEYNPDLDDNKNIDEENKSDEVNLDTNKNPNIGEDGLIHHKVTLAGTSEGRVFDYKIAATAKFSAYIRNSLTVEELSSDGMINLTYYELDRTVDGKSAVGARQFIEMKGDKGTKWFMLNEFEIPNENSISVIDNWHAGLNSIYLGFSPLDKFDGKMYESSSTDSVMSLMFNYSDSLKSVLKSITLEVDGVKKNVDINEIDYSGKFITGFLGMIFPEDDEVRIIKEMGLGE